MGQLSCPGVTAEHGSVAALLALVTLVPAHDASSGQQRHLGSMCRKKKQHRFGFRFPLLKNTQCFYVPVLGCEMKVIPPLTAVVLLWSVFPSYVMLGQVFCFCPIALAIK